MEHGDGPAWALAIEHSALGHIMRDSVWIYPAANVAHVLAIAFLLGSIALLDLRLLGAGPPLSTDRLARLALPVAITGLAVAAPTGFLLFAAEASAYIRNPVFLLKMGAIVAALINVAAFHAGPFRAVKAWGGGPAPTPARMAAALSLGLWLSAAAAGRLIAYF